MSSRITLNQSAIKALALVILTAIGGIILLSLWGLTLRFGLLGAEQSDGNTVADEALSTLGNIAAAAVGGLVGWLTRDYVESQRTTGYQDIPAGASITPPPSVNSATSSAEPLNGPGDVEGSFEFPDPAANDLAEEVIDLRDPVEDTSGYPRDDEPGT